MARKQYFAVLVGAGSFTAPWGERFTRGVPKPISDSNLEYFEMNQAWFQIRAASPAGQVEVRSKRSRADVRAKKAEVALEAAEERDVERDEDDWVPKSEIDEIGELSRIERLAQMKIDGRWTLDRLKGLVHEIGVWPEEMDREVDLCTKKDLLVGITRAQTRLLAELQGDLSEEVEAEVDETIDDALEEIEEVQEE